MFYTLQNGNPNSVLEKKIAQQFLPQLLMLETLFNLRPISCPWMSKPPQKKNLTPSSLSSDLSLLESDFSFSSFSSLPSLSPSSAAEQAQNAKKNPNMRLTLLCYTRVAEEAKYIKMQIARYCNCNPLMTSLGRTLTAVRGCDPDLSL